MNKYYENIYYITVEKFVNPFKYHSNFPKIFLVFEEIQSVPFLLFFQSLFLNVPGEMSNAIRKYGIN